MTESSDRAQAVAKLYEAHHHELTRYARWCGADDPENIASEAFDLLLESDRSIDKPLPWLRKVIHNLICNRARRIERDRKFAALIGSDPITTPSAEHEAALREDQRSVINALKQLPLRQREVLVYRFYYGRSEAEIAADLGIAAGTVKKHAHRGIENLRKILEGEK
jgi:RNA polymerase sigma factor (sigma-70 family)